MNRKEAAELMPIIQAFAEGKDIEYRTKGFNEDWKKATQIPELSFKSFEYRIKPEPKYRPFANAEECLQEMLKHQPFGWVKSKDKGYFHLIGLVQWESELEDVMITFATSEQLACSSRSIYENYIFANGTPFGIKEE